MNVIFSIFPTNILTQICICRYEMILCHDGVLYMWKSQLNQYRRGKCEEKNCLKASNIYRYKCSNVLSSSLLWLHIILFNFHLARLRTHVFVIFDIDVTFSTQAYIFQLQVKIKLFTFFLLDSLSVNICTHQRWLKGSFNILLFKLKALGTLVYQYDRNSNNFGTNIKRTSNKSHAC